MMKTKTKNRKRLKTKTKTKMPKQQNLSLNESASIQYGAYGCYGRMALRGRPDLLLAVSYVTTGTESDVCKC